MHSDIPRTVIITNQKPPAEIRHFSKISQSDIPNNDPSASPRPEAPDLGGYPVTSGGTAGTASGVSLSTTAPNPSFGWGRPPYIIPRDGAILEVEVDRQIEAANLQEESENVQK